MRHGFASFVRAALVLFLLSAGLPGLGQVSQRDSESIRSFLDSSARFIYFLAWPTATYRTYGLEGIHLAQGGFDVTVKLDGTSGLDGSDLWVELIVPIRDGGLKQPYVLRHNAFVMDPFVTTQITGQALAQLSQQYANANNTASPPSITPVAPVRPVSPTNAFTSSDAVCIVNSTGMDLTYAFRWGSADWTRDKLAQGMQAVYFWKNNAEQPGSPQFTIDYDDDPYTEGVQPHRYTLDRAAASVNPECDAARQYVFQLSGGKILMFSR